MPVGPLQSTKRALVKVLLALAAVYNVALVITRESADADVVMAYRNEVAPRQGRKNKGSAKSAGICLKRGGKFRHYNSEDARDHHSNARAASSNAAPPGDFGGPT